MPKGGWVNLSIKKEVREKLEELRNKNNLTSLSDVVSLLIVYYENTKNMEELIKKLVERLEQNSMIK